MFLPCCGSGKGCFASHCHAERSVYAWPGCTPDDPAMSGQPSLEREREAAMVAAQGLAGVTPPAARRGDVSDEGNTGAGGNAGAGAVSDELLRPQQLSGRGVGAYHSRCSIGYGKYQVEVELATRHAKLLQCVGARWRPRPVRPEPEGEYEAVIGSKEWFRKHRPPTPGAVFPPPAPPREKRYVCRGGRCFWSADGVHEHKAELYRGELQISVPATGILPPDSGEMRIGDGSGVGTGAGTGAVRRKALTALVHLEPPRGAEGGAREMPVQYSPACPLRPAPPTSESWGRAISPPRPGYCGMTDTGVSGDCVGGSRGSWVIGPGSPHNITSARDCVLRCATACAACAFLSISLQARPCPPPPPPPHPLTATTTTANHFRHSLAPVAPRDPPRPALLVAGA